MSDHSSNHLRQKGQVLAHTTGKDQVDLQIAGIRELRLWVTPATGFLLTISSIYLVPSVAD